MDGTSTTFHWLRTGEEGLRAMLEAVAAARESVRLETYIFQSDAVGEEFRTALTQAARRGVRVQVLVDALGSLSLPTDYFHPLTDAGGEGAWFNPLSLRRWSYRDHRKLLVCDDAVGFVGGFNISQEYSGDGVTKGWRDLGLRVTGAPARALAGSFDGFFARASERHKRLQRLRKARQEVAAGPNWQLLTSGPGRRPGDLKRTLVRDLAVARSVRIACAYFLPTSRLRKALLRASRHGLPVQLLLAGKSDVLASQLASRRLYRVFLRAGTQIFEYQPQVLHAKLFLVDDLVYVGSSNLDVRSLRINYELVVRVNDPRLAAEGREMFEEDLQHSRRVERAAWAASRTFWEKLKEQWAYFLLARLDPYLAKQQLRTLR